jgi:alpha-tubulin suppressor-like RCC1 family protein
LFTWGFNAQGQLGDVTTNNKSSPVQIGFSSWTAVAGGQYHTAAVRSDGRLFTWGNNATFGALGDNSTANRSSPVQIGSSSWTAVGAGFSHTAAIGVDGALFTWGYNNQGNLGLDDLISRSSPVTIGLSRLIVSSPVQIGSSSWTAVAAGSFFTAAIRSDGYLFSWGTNSIGQLGDGTFVNKSSPVQIGSDSWTGVSAGLFAHTTAIRSDKRLFTWGYNGQGQLGDNTTVNKSSPVMVSGVPTNASVSSPVQIGFSSWTAVSAGRSHTAAIRSDGLLFTWGRNNRGQLGDTTVTSRSSPVQIGSSSWTAVSAGSYHTAAIRSGGTLFVWGWGAYGRIGDSGNSTRYSPVQIGNSSWTVVSAGDQHTLAIRSGGTLFAWGRYRYGRLGVQGSGYGNRYSPVQVGAAAGFGSTSWVAVSAGYQHTLAIRSGGTLFTWGRNNRGQLGLGFFGSTRYSPVQIGSSSWTAVAASAYAHSAAIRSDGYLFTWGINYGGQLGDGTTTTKTSPVQIGSSSWTAISANSRYNTSAIRSDGKLFTWGNNAYGQLGDNTTTGKSSPVQIGSSSWSAVATGRYHTAGISP